MPTDVQIRRAAAVESDRVADLMWRVRRQSAVRGSIPPSEHPLMDMRTWMSLLMRADHDVWVAVDDGRYVGLLILSEPDWLEHLYLDESHTGQGLGGRLVDLAKQELGGTVQLWTFQSNQGACRFYERHGFVAVEQTDGDNEEGEPDVRYVYEPEQA
jgi:GNAT superfamily N-acetyltransferase